jgi:hypothetical protein
MSEDNYHTELITYDKISVLEELVVEVGCEIVTGWLDGRLHMPPGFDHIVVEAKIITPQEDESSFLNVTFQELQKNATVSSPYFKRASPLGVGSGQYQIKILVKNICFILPYSPNKFIFSATPKVRFYVDGIRMPVVDMSYPPDPEECNLDKEGISVKDSTHQWPISYKEEIN